MLRPVVGQLHEDGFFLRKASNERGVFSCVDLITQVRFVEFGT